MSGFAAGLERTVVLLVGLLLVAVGASAVAWQQGWIPDAVDRIDASALTEHTGEPWWPWAIGGAGIVLIVIGVCWLVAHGRRHTISRLRLAGSSRQGRLAADASAVVDAAGAAFETAPGVAFRGGRLWRDRGELTVDLRASAAPSTDLAEAAAAADRAATAARSHLGDDSDAHLRVVLVGARRRAGTRVR
ncbi:hypothetical protein [Jiangella muralis]|uniref:hypothetical protein n=1 Tax=Jiangella muralis TaxID=702383 RepID=UPI00069EE581|nr:hypothetical protein [Jiangella muralis]